MKKNYLDAYTALALTLRELMIPLDKDSEETIRAQQALYDSLEVELQEFVDELWRKLRAEADKAKALVMWLVMTFAAHEFPDLFPDEADRLWRNYESIAFLLSELNYSPEEESNFLMLAASHLIKTSTLEKDNALKILRNLWYAAHLAGARYLPHWWIAMYHKAMTFADEHNKPHLAIFFNYAFYHISRLDFNLYYPELAARLKSKKNKRAYHEVVVLHGLFVTTSPGYAAALSKPTVQCRK